MISWEKKTRCPKCGHHHNMVASVRGEIAPEPGDYTLCIWCGAFLRFTDVGLEPADLLNANISDGDRRRMRRAQQIIWNRN